MNKSVLRETTPLSARDCFMVFSREKKEFTYPTHVHNEFELNFIENGAGAKRIVGDSIEEIEDLELTLVANPDMEHGWINGNCKSKCIKEITIQFHGNLLNDDLLQKNQFRSIKEMFERAAYGLTFPRDVIVEIKSKLYALASQNAGAYSVFTFFALLYDLSLVTTARELSSKSFSFATQCYNSRRVKRAFNFMFENYEKQIALSDVANLIGMTDTSFSRFFKKHTGKSFVETLNSIRLGHASRMLVDTTHNIVEISMSCGFNNLSNFNRLFKKNKGCTPCEFRENYKQSRIFL